MWGDDDILATRNRRVRAASDNAISQYADLGLVKARKHIVHLTKSRDIILWTFRFRCVQNSILCFEQLRCVSN